LIKGSIQMKNISIAIGTATLLLIGCNSAPTTQSTPPTYAGCKTWDQQGGTPSLAAASVLSPELAKIIGIQEVFTSRTATGMATVQAAVYNCSDVDVVLSVRARFNGDRGQSEPPSAWRNVFLPPRGQVTYGESAVSLSTNRVSVDIYDANRGQSQFAPGQTYVVPTQK
jgi:hypothetical protein